MNDMSDKSFEFKEFRVEQAGSAMKVGTDGVLLGAWIEIDHNAVSILDIGTGTGLIALQLAQRSDCETIDALEIEENSFEQAVENFENSPWSDRLFCYHASLQEFKEEMDLTYDLIVCNPPFYNNSFPAEGKERSLARQQNELDFAELMDSVDKLLTKTGSFALILPYSGEDELINLAGSRGLYVNRITRVRGNKNSSIKRSLIQFSYTQQIVRENELILELDRHVYTPEYYDLVKDFYLKL